MTLPFATKPRSWLGSLPLLCLAMATGCLAGVGCAGGGTRARPDGGGDSWDAASQPDAAVFYDSGPGMDGSSWQDAAPIPDATSPPDAQDCAGGCNNPPGPCYVTPGNCLNGVCDYPPKSYGVGCDDGDPCTGDDICDGNGLCYGDFIDCSRPQAHGGSCVGGTCQGWTCDTGWGDCNTNMSDGCEQSLDTLDHCEYCNTPCPSRPQATPSCSSGSCTYTCQSPYENCNNDWSDGCEIPTGVANECDLETGLNSFDGCGTAYCGTAPTTNNTMDYGHWYCAICSNCHEPSAGMCQWCDVVDDTGRWFTAESCACGSYLDLVCSP